MGDIAMYVSPICALGIVETATHCRPRCNAKTGASEKTTQGEFSRRGRFFSGACAGDSESEVEKAPEIAFFFDELTVTGPLGNGVSEVESGAELFSGEGFQVPFCWFRMRW